MAVKKVYYNSVGPFLYDDTDAIDDYDGDFSGETRQALTTEGQLLVEGEPVDDNNITRFIDILTFITEVFTSTGTIDKNTQVVLVSGTFDLFLPTLANGDKRIYEVKNYGTGIVTLKPHTTEAAKTIDGETSQAIRAKDALTVNGDNTNDSWWII